MRRFVIALFVSTMLLQPSYARAQAAAGTPQTPTREEIERAPITPKPSTSESRLTVEGDIERAPCPLADPSYSAINVTIADVQFSGMGSVSSEPLKAAWSDYVGRTVSLASVCEIRDRAATILRRQGYLAAVQVPPQRIENGVVHFDVLFARLTGFQVRGDAGKSEGIIGRYLKAIQDQPVFNIRAAERYLLLARDLPGFDIRLTLRPAGTTPGEVIGEVLVVRTPLVVDLSVQNYGSREVGRGGGLLQARINGLLGLGDQTTLGVFTTHDFREQQVLQASETIRVGSEGLRLGADFSYAWTRPTLGAGLSIKSQTLVATARAQYPIIRRQSFNLWAAAGFDFIDQSSTFNGLDLSQDNLRVPFVRFDYDAIDPESIVSTTGYSGSEPRWRVGASVELRHGIDVFGASPDCSISASNCSGLSISPSKNADSSAFVVRASALLEYRPIPILAFSLQPRAQYSPSTLFSYEQFSAGNYTVGRGFDPGTLIGDSGLGVRTEASIGSLVPQSRRDFAFQGYGFLDAAWVWNDRVAGSQKLQSAGGGVRVAFGDRFLFDANLAVPFDKAGLQARRGDTRVLVSLTTRLFPFDVR